MNKYLRAALCVLALAGLAACVPEDRHSRFERQHEAARAEIHQQALAVIQFALSSQNALSRNTGWQAGTLAQGTFAALGIAVENTVGMSRGELASGYCQDLAGGETKDMVVSWFTSRTAAGFYQRGLGQNAGPAIAAEIARLSGNTFAGLSRAGVIELAGGIDRLGTAQITLPPGCTLNIPEDSPVVVAYMTREETGTHLNTAMQYIPERCGANQFGSNIKERYAQQDDVTGTRNQTDPETFFNGCVSSVPVCAWRQEGRERRDCSGFDLGCNGNPPCNLANKDKSWSWGRGSKPIMMCRCT